MIIPGLVRVRAEPFCSLQPRGFAPKLLIFVYSFVLNNKLNDPIVKSLVRSRSHVFNDIHSGVKSYMTTHTSSQTYVTVVTIQYTTIPSKTAIKDAFSHTGQDEMKELITVTRLEI